MTLYCKVCIPVADSFWYLAKLIQLCKFKNKIKLKKKETLQTTKKKYFHWENTLYKYVSI